MRVPVVFGKYLLLERISVGGMAEVFKAKVFGAEGFEKIIAIKRILPSMAEDHEFITMFIDEAKIAGQLSHANICQIYELGKIEDSHFIAMEYVQGKDVLQIQNRCRRLRRRLPLPMAAYIAAKVCEGLDYAHRKRDARKRPLDIIHRDVSPQNILVSYEGEVKIIDFGIAKAMSRSSKTQAGVLKGKFGYMSPEQVRGEPMDRRSDMFAIGTLLWEMCTDERLFTGPSDFAVLDKVRNASVPPPSAHNPMIPPELEAIIMRALRRDPAERYQWATEMHEALLSYLASRSPPWSGAAVSRTLRKLFEREIIREQKALERYKSIRHDDLVKYATPAPEPAKAVSLLHQPDQAAASMPGRAPGVRTTEVDEAELHVGPSLGAHPTDIGHDLGPAEAGVDAPIGEALGPIDTVDSESGATRVFGAGLGDGQGSLTAEPTFIFNVELGQVVQAGERPIALIDSGSGNGEARPAAPDNGPTVVFNIEDELAHAAPAAAAGSITSTAAVPSPPPTMIKDILIGVLSAAVLILVGVVVWSIWGPPRVPASALVVNTTMSSAAEVMVDGESRGTVRPGSPLTLKTIAPGPHRVVLLPEDGEPEARRIEVAAGDVKVVTVGPPRASAVARAVSAAAPKGDTALAPQLDGGARPGGGDAGAPGQGAAVATALVDQQASHADAVTGTPGAVGTRGERRKHRPEQGHGREHQPSVRTRHHDTESASHAGGSNRERNEQGSFGYLVANTIPWARVYVDGRNTGRATPIPQSSRLELQAGQHEVTFESNGKRYTYTVDISAGRTTRLIETLPIQ